jgi:hypothetical protein
MTVAVTPAITGTQIANTPAAIISTLITIDHVVALCTSAVIEFRMSQFLL